MQAAILARRMKSDVAALVLQAVVTIARDKQWTPADVHQCATLLRAFLLQDGVYEPTNREDRRPATSGKDGKAEKPAQPA